MLITPFVTTFVPLAPLTGKAARVIENVPTAEFDVTEVRVTVPLAPGSSVSKIIPVVAFGLTCRDPFGGIL